MKDVELVDQTNDLLSHLELLAMASRGMRDRQESNSMQDGIASAIDMLQSIKSLVLGEAASNSPS